MKNHEWFHLHDWSVRKLETKSLGGRGGGGGGASSSGLHDKISMKCTRPPFNPSTWRGSATNTSSATTEDNLGGPVICLTRPIGSGVGTGGLNNVHDMDDPSSKQQQVQHYRGQQLQNHSMHANRKTHYIEKEVNYGGLSNEQQLLFEGFEHRTTVAAANKATNKPIKTTAHVQTKLSGYSSASSSSALHKPPTAAAHEKHRLSLY